ncbi:MAG: hypothetical protein HKM04_00765 [Legionellales bacterium]|nr:hypothetical protein [Legionellales bacterium]
MLVQDASEQLKIIKKASHTPKIFEQFSVRTQLCYALETLQLQLNKQQIDVSKLYLSLSNYISRNKDKNRSNKQNQAFRILEQLVNDIGDTINKDFSLKIEESNSNYGF